MRLDLITDLGIDKAGSRFATFVSDTRLEDMVVRTGKIKDGEGFNCSKLCGKLSTIVKIRVTLSKCIQIATRKYQDFISL